jgi:hypothetical protein
MENCECGNISCDKNHSWYHPYNYTITSLIRPRNSISNLYPSVLYVRKEENHLDVLQKYFVSSVINILSFYTIQYHHYIIFFEKLIAQCPIGGIVLRNGYTISQDELLSFHNESYFIGFCCVVFVYTFEKFRYLQKGCANTGEYLNEEFCKLASNCSNIRRWGYLQITEIFQNKEFILGQLHLFKNNPSY